jgi:hypothetical protein
MRKIIIAASLLLAVIAGGVIYLFLSIDSIVKTLIETVGSEVAGTKVSVGSVSIALSDGKASISGLRVANPAGFSSNPAISLGAIEVAIDKASVTKQPIIIKDIRIAAPSVAAEISPQGSNLLALSDHLHNRSAGKPAAEAPAAEKTTDKQSDQPADKKAASKVIIDRLTIAQGQVSLTAAAGPGLSTNSSATLGEIVLTGIGRDSGGATAEQVARQVLDAVLKAATKSSSGLGGIEGTVTDKVKTLIPGPAADAMKGLFGK